MRSSHTTCYGAMCDERADRHFHRGGYFGFRPRNPAELVKKKKREGREDRVWREGKRKDSATLCKRNEDLWLELDMFGDAEFDEGNGGQCARVGVEVPVFPTALPHLGNELHRGQGSDTVEGECGEDGGAEVCLKLEKMSLNDAFGATFEDPRDMQVRSVIAIRVYLESRCHPLERFGVHRFVEPVECTTGNSWRVAKGDRLVEEVVADLVPAQFRVSAKHDMNDRENTQLTAQPIFLLLLVNITHR
ncbi:hypothetical protein K438DRAFT_796640 [Mycena galopus ATCC 62051]|nr:hypothetical protein K438DRAFT_796640 [Mycena galopus ATCC 62051]